jgi:acyl-CoA thioesterase-1
MAKFALFLLLFSLTAHAEQTLVILGDSLSEGYGVPKAKSYPHLLQEKLRADGKKWKVVSSSVSGSTTASASSRMQWVLKSKPDAILIALGGNDGLRGFQTKVIEENLVKAANLAKEKNVKVFLAGVRMPPNFGNAYTKDYERSFPSAAKRAGVPLLPDLLAGVGGVVKLNQDDRIHPNEEGHRILAETAFSFLKDRL